MFRKANGESKVISAIVRKVYEGETGFMPEHWHERFKIALSHDQVTIESDKYMGDVVQDGEYTVDWPDFMNVTEAKGGFSAEVTPFNASNSNCKTCEEVSQLSLEDDTFEDPLGEDGQYSINVADNDNICCAPSVFSITSFDSSILASASIDQEGNITIETQAELEDATRAKLLTYRVTCPDGSYDEASVYADIEGSIEACLAPANLHLVSISGSDATVEWDAVSGADSYTVQLFKSDLPGTPVHTDTVTGTSKSYNDLETAYSLTYYVRVVTNCPDDQSPAAEVSFPNDVFEQTCGSFGITFVGSVLDYGKLKTVAYINCQGQLVHENFYITKVVCASLSSPGVPLLIQTIGWNTIITYNGTC